MKYRTLEYLKKSKARKRMQHPTDLETFLKAELDICENSVVRKHIKKTLEQLLPPSSPNGAQIEA
jgi:hypothetical protein